MAGRNPQRGAPLVANGQLTVASLLDIPAERRTPSVTMLLALVPLDTHLTRSHVTARCKSPARCLDNRGCADALLERARMICTTCHHDCGTLEGLRNHLRGNKGHRAGRHSVKRWTKQRDDALAALGAGCDRIDNLVLLADALLSLALLRRL
jgi:hypothetical protein